MPRKRQGLEGLPVSSGEVWEFDALRATSSVSDVAGLVVSWLLLLGIIALAVWDSSIGLGVVAGVVSVLLSWWTISKLRRRAAERWMMRRVREREADQ